MTIPKQDFQTRIMDLRACFQISKRKYECIVESVRNIERNYWMNTSKDTIEAVTVAGIYDLRRLQIKRCGRLGQRAVLASDIELSLHSLRLRNQRHQVRKSNQHKYADYHQHDQHLWKGEGPEALSLIEFSDCHTY